MATRTDRLQVIFEVGGDGKLKATLGDIGKSGEQAAAGLDKAGASTARMVTAVKATAAVLGGLVTDIGLVIKNTMEAERVDAQLEARLKSTAGAAGMTKQALDDLAAAQARKTTFDDEAIKSAESMLLTFTKIHADVFPRAIDAITDMATAMGTDLEGASVQVGKALNSPIEGVSALTRVGVQFTDAQKDMIETLVETGRQAEAQAIILAELETQFGGAAEAARDTLGGALVALKNTLMDLTEGSGGSLDGATQSVNNLIDALNDPEVKDGAAAITSAIFSIGEAAVVASGKIGSLISSYQNWLGMKGFTRGEEGDSLEHLMARSDKLTVAQARRANSNGYAGVNDPISKMLGIDEKVAGELQRVNGLIDKAIKDSGYTQTDLIRLPLPGKMPVPYLNDFNFAADMAARSSAAASASSAGGGGGGGGGRGGRSGGSRASAPRAMPDFYGQTVEDIQREIEQAARLDEQWQKLAATLAGPLASAEFEHKQNLAEIEELGRKSGASAEDITRAKEQETAQYEKQRAEIEASLDPMGQLLAAYQQEIDAMGMGNAERAMANELRRQGIDLASEEAAVFMDLARAKDQQARDVSDALGYADDLKSGIHGFLMDLRKDAVGTFKDIGDYFEQLLSRMLSRALDSQLDEWFQNLGKGGGSGSGGGGGGGFWGGLLSSIFSSGSSSSGWSGSLTGSVNSGSGLGSGLTSTYGSGWNPFEAGGVMTAQGPIPLHMYATGGIARSPQVAIFGEGRKPEAYVPLPDGRSIPVTMAGGGGGDQHYTIINQIRGDVSARTSSQMAGRLAEKLQRAGRNR